MVWGSNSGRDKKFFFFKTSRPALQPIRPPIQWVPEFFLGVKVTTSMKLTTHLHLVARLKMSGSVLHLYDRPSWHGQENLYLLQTENCNIRTDESFNHTQIKMQKWWKMNVLAWNAILTNTKLSQKADFLHPRFTFMLPYDLVEWCHLSKKCQIMNECRQN